MRRGPLWWEPHGGHQRASPGHPSWITGTAYGLPNWSTYVVGGEQLDFRTATLHVRRVKKGTPSVHPISGDELRALRRLQREQEPKSPFVLPPQGAAQCGPCAAPQD